ncbi:MAG: hypothetical protein ACREPP_10290 [Rhodanobacteraceae bacterium]
MEALKRVLVAAFAPAAQRWALVEGSRHVPNAEPLTSRGRSNGKRARPRAIWRIALAR